jgi:hypothetical protein
VKFDTTENKSGGVEMKGRILTVSVIMILFLLMTGCGKKEKIDYFKYASYDDFVSTSGEYSTAYNIYIQGKLLSTEVMYLDDVPYLVAIVQESGNKEWICRIGAAGCYTDEVLADYVGKKLTFFGDYVSKYDGKPILQLNLSSSNEHCVRKVGLLEPTTVDICVKDDFVATENYMINWCEVNCKNVIYEKAKSDGKAGTYKSTGLIKRASKTSITLVQRENGIFYTGNIYPDNKNYWISDFSKAADLEEGTAISVYYTINEKGHVTPVGYSISKEKLNFTLDDAKVATSEEVLINKEYAYGEHGTIELDLLKNKQDGTYTLMSSATVDSIANALIEIVYFEMYFENIDMNYTISTILNDSKAFILISNKNGTTTIAGSEADGTVVMSAPSWFDESNFTDDGQGESIAVLTDMMKNFTEEIGKL